MKLRLFQSRKKAEPKERDRPINGTENMNYVGFVRGDYTLQNSALIFAAASRIANALASMPVHVYKGNQRIRSDPRDVLLSSRPNKFMTAPLFFRTLELCRCTYGNAYALKIVDANAQVERLDVLDPSCVTPFINSDTQELWYQLSPPFSPQYFVHSWYMLHIPFAAANGITGISPISVLQDTLDFQANIDHMSLEQIKRGINAQIVLEAPASLGESQRQRMIEDFVETYKQSGGNVLLLESGVSAKALNLSAIDSKKFEVEKLTRSKVAMVYSLPPHLLGDYSDSSFASQEQQTLEFSVLTMLPIVTLYERGLDLLLFSTSEIKDGWHAAFDMDELTRADSATRANSNQMSIRGGWKTPNEVRYGYGLPPDPDGDTLLVSRDLTPLRAVIRGEVDKNGNT